MSLNIGSSLHPQEQYPQAVMFVLFPGLCHQLEKSRGFPDARLSFTWALRAAGEAEGRARYMCAVFSTCVQAAE